MPGVTFREADTTAARCRGSSAPRPSPDLCACPFESDLIVFRPFLRFVNIISDSSPVFSSPRGSPPCHPSTARQDLAAHPPEPGGAGQVKGTPAPQPACSLARWQPCSIPPCCLSPPVHACRAQPQVGGSGAELRDARCCQVAARAVPSWCFPRCLVCSQGKAAPEPCCHPSPWPSHPSVSCLCCTGNWVSRLGLSPFGQWASPAALSLPASSTRGAQPMVLLIALPCRALPTATGWGLCPGCCLFGYSLIPISAQPHFRLFLGSSGPGGQAGTGHSRVGEG